MARDLAVPPALDLPDGIPLTASLRCIGAPLPNGADQNRPLPPDGVELVLRYKKKQVVTTPERLSVEACRELMAFLEKEHPEWVCYFAVALFAGVRPDMTHGEMSKLAVKVGEHGSSAITGWQISLLRRHHEGWPRPAHRGAAKPRRLDRAPEHFE